MKRILIAILLVLLPGAVLRAQTSRADTVRTAQVDSTLVGRSILSVLGSGVTVDQSPAMKAAFDRYVSANSAKKISGYRIRVYFSSDKDARDRSDAITRSIMSTYPGMGVYRTFTSPNFNVCVGDFRTKDEALKTFHALKAVYPTAILIRDQINYPR